MAKIGVIYANNITIPAISGYGAEIVCNVVEKETGYEPVLVDLVKSMYPDTDWKRSTKWKVAIRDAIAEHSPELLLLSMRNASVVYFTDFFSEERDHGSFIPWYQAVALEIAAAGFPLERVVAGGVGFGTMPEHVLNATGIRYGVVGAAEKHLPRTIEHILKGDIWTTRGFLERGSRFFLPGRERCGTPSYSISRKFFDNPWYEDHGGTIALRLDHGCLMDCSYCAEPDSKGAVFQNSVENVLKEFDDLYSQGIRYIQFADSEFNFNPSLKKDFLRGVIARGYGGIHFAAYMQPAPLDEELISLLAKAGCDGINFSSDNIDALLLRGGCNKWWYARTSEEPKEMIARAESLCRDYGIRTKHEVMIGLPGDTLENVQRNLDFFLELDPYVIGLTVGIGVLPSSQFYKRFVTDDLRARARKDPKSLQKEGFFTLGDIGYDGATYFVDPSLKVPGIFFKIKEKIGDKQNVRYHNPDCSFHAGDNSVPFNPSIEEKLSQGIRGVDISW